VLDEVLRYEFGVFDRDGRNARSVSGSRVSADTTRVGRVTAQPFRGTEFVAEDLTVGVAWSSSTVPEGLSAIRGRTTLGETFFSADYPVNGARSRLGFEGRWRAGPFKVQAEYIRVLEERLDQSVEDTALSPLRARGWYAQVGWVLTGDDKSDGLGSPKRPFLQGGPGAIEVAARVERLTFDSTGAGEVASSSPRAEVIVGNRNRILTVGLNWYLNRWVKVQFNLVRETLSDPLQGPRPSSPSFSSRLVRFQFQL
jgi:phosphate-selective porin OprO/OprP